MTNLDKWLFYMKDCVSPEIFIKWSFHSLVASYLERRVWNGSSGFNLYPNLYIILVGPSAVGKGRAISPVKDAYKKHKYVANADAIFTNALDDEKGKDPGSLIQIAPDSTTYQSIVLALAKSIRAKYVVPTGGVPGKKIPCLHSSMTFCLEELSSLMRKNTEELVNFLLIAYDCGDYTHETIYRGRDNVKRCCLNILGGTTPEYLQTIFDDRLLSEGFGSRTHFIMAEKPRYRTLKPIIIEPDQTKCYIEVLNHLKDLTDLYGEVTFTDEALTYMENWWKTEPLTRINKSSKLNPYFGRKDIHLKKLSMVIHFADCANKMQVELDSVLKAEAELIEAELTMDKALKFKKKNSIAQLTESIFNYIKDAKRGVSKGELAQIFWDDLPQQQESLDKIIEYLKTSTKQITLKDGKYILI